MSKTAILEYNGEKYEFPIIVGSENEPAIDINKLRDLTGAITLDPGYKNSGSCESKITFLDGEEGILRYRGYAIEDLAEKANFLEVSYLVIFGELPTKTQLTQFETDIRKYTLVNEEMKNIIDGFPKGFLPEEQIPVALKELIKEGVRGVCLECIVTAELKEIEDTPDDNLPLLINRDFITYDAYNYYCSRVTGGKRTALCGSSCGVVESFTWTSYGIGVSEK